MRQFTGPSYDLPSYFRGVCEAIATEGSSEFLISPGDIDPPANVRWTIDKYLGSGFVWYPVAGNHETETPEDMTWLRACNAGGNTLPGVVNTGPSGCLETTFSFDYANAHFAVINQYYDGTSDIGTDGDVADALYNWLVADLAATAKQHIFVIGHEPAYVRPDMDNGRLRHLGDSLDEYPSNRDRFWSLLKQRGVAAYICGHTHNTSVFDTLGVLQLDAGHARGLGDTGAASSFMLVRVNDARITYEIYRDTGGTSWDYQDIVHTRKASVLLDAKLVLEGPYDASADSMTAVLSGSGMPLTAPYGEDPRSVLSIPGRVVDWLLLQLRLSPADTAVFSKSVFLRSDGRLVSDTGSTGGISMEVSAGEYHVIVRHRNHLAVMSKTAPSLNSDLPVPYDFSTGAGQVYNDDAQFLETGVYGLVAGDANGTGTVDANDRSAAWNDRNKTGYENSDCNLSGTVDANDRSITWNNRNKTTSVP
jgi:hypothetical protein